MTPITQAISRHISKQGITNRILNYPENPEQDINYQDITSRILVFTKPHNHYVYITQSNTTIILTSNTTINKTWNTSDPNLLKEIVEILHKLTRY